MMMMIIFTKITLSAVKNEYLKYVLFLLPCEIWTWPCMFIILKIQSRIQYGIQSDIRSNPLLLRKGEKWCLYKVVGHSVIIISSFCF